MISSYQPNAHTLQRLAKVTFVAVVGPSGVGKTTLMNASAKQEPTLHRVIGETSRAPRPGERDGVDFYFRTRKALLERIAKRTYVQVPPNITGDLYATAPESYIPEGVSMLAIWADAVSQFRALPFKAMRTIFVVPPSYEVWQERIMGAGRDLVEEHIAKRLVEAQHSFAFAQTDPQTLFVINNELTTATTDFIHLALGRSLTQELKDQQAQAHKIIAAIMRRL